MKKKMNDTKIRRRIAKQKAEVLVALEKSAGIVATACKAVNISRFTFYDWMKKDAEFAEKVEDIMEAQKDFVEAQILKKIKEGDSTMTIFYAKTKMKDRGYVERQEITGANGQPLATQHEVDLSKLTKEQREALLSIGEEVLNGEKS